LDSLKEARPKSYIFENKHDQRWKSAENILWIPETFVVRFSRSRLSLSGSCDLLKNQRDMVKHASVGKRQYRLTLVPSFVLGQNEKRYQIN